MAATQRIQDDLQRFKLSISKYAMRLHGRSSQCVRNENISRVYRQTNKIKRTKTRSRQQFSGRKCPADIRGQRSETDCFQLITKGCIRASLNSRRAHSQKPDDRRRKNISWSDDSPTASRLYPSLVFRLV